MSSSTSTLPVVEIQRPVTKRSATNADQDEAKKKRCRLCPVKKDMCIKCGQAICQELYRTICLSRQFQSHNVIALHLWNHFRFTFSSNQERLKANNTFLYFNSFVQLPSDYKILNQFTYNALVSVNIAIESGSLGMYGGTQPPE